MNDMLQQLMNMIENARTIPALTDISMIGFAVLLVFGAINCILGYRLLRFWMMLCGFIIGAGVGFGVAYSSGVTEKYMYAVIMVGIGVVFAVIAFVSYKIGIFILGAGIGIGLGIYIFHPTSSLVFFFCPCHAAGERSSDRRNFSSGWCYGGCFSSKAWRTCRCSLWTGDECRICNSRNADSVCNEPP